MLTDLGALLAALNAPLYNMGYGMTQNAATYAVGPLASQPMSTIAFNVFAGPWIASLGDLAMALGTFMLSLNTFLINLADALA